MKNYQIVLFDGVCNLCNKAVQRIIKNDPKGRFKFAALQSEIGQKLLQDYNLIDKNIDSIVLISHKKAHYYSGAALRIAKQMSGGYCLLWPLIIVPYFLRDWGYKFIAQRRYKWFGRQAEDSCMLPTAELKSRFL
jgi:predicted DCC family thiol-disulfide oxidoreductase YuxK